jgi:hypothetical protein
MKVVGFFAADSIAAPDVPDPTALSFLLLVKAKSHYF